MEERWRVAEWQRSGRVSDRERDARDLGQISMTSAGAVRPGRLAPPTKQEQARRSRAHVIHASLLSAKASHDASHSHLLLFTRLLHDRKLLDCVEEEVT